MNLNATELQAITKGLDKIDDRLNQELPELRDRVLTLEQRGFNAPRDTGTGGSGTTLGAELAQKLAAHRDEFNRAGRIKIELKGDLLAPNVGRHGHRTMPGAAFDTSFWSVAARLAPTGLGPMQTLHYSRRTHPTPPVPPTPEPIQLTGAQIQAGEGAAKARTDLTYVPIAQNQITIAGWTQASKQALDSEAGLSIIVDGFLRQQVMERIAAVLMGGSAEPTALWTGFTGLAVPTTQYVPALYSRLEDAIAKAAMMMRAQGYAPGVLVVNPLSWGNIAFRIGDDGDYVHGSPMVTPPDTFSGMSVAFDASVAQGEAILIDPRFCGWGYTSPLSVSVGQPDDQFTKNMYTLLGEASLIPWCHDTKSVRRVIKADEA